MRIVSYNILEGGIGRADPIAEVLLAQRADVIGLVEADDPAMLDRIAWRLGFDCIAGEGRKGRTAAILTRGRILESINHAARLLNAGRQPGVADGGEAETRRATAARRASRAAPPRSFLEATVEVDQRELTLAVVHTSAKASRRRERRRQRQIASVLEVLADRRAAGTAHVLIGDFNATAPVQELVRERIPPKNRKYFDRYGDLPRAAIRSVLEAGYLDSLAEHDPAAARTAGTFTTLEPGQRVDYIFTFGLGRRQIASAWIETDRLATYASDHYPIGAQITL